MGAIFVDFFPHDFFFFQIHRLEKTIEGEHFQGQILALPVSSSLEFLFVGNI